ncbi:M48 family metalloprotease [Candidatus Raskinella chloraquaticus]
MLSKTEEGIVLNKVMAGRIRWCGLALAAGLLSSCVAFGPAQNSPAEVTAVPLPTPAPRAETAKKRVPAQVERNFGGAYDSPDIERRLATIVQRLVPVSERPDLRYSVTILNAPTINAFALPDGQLFVTRGLVALANDEAEIAAVLAHEMSHVIARHATQRVEAAQKTLLGSRVLSIVTGDRALGQQALVSGALSLASFSRQQEIEADQIGIRNIYRAGFDPYGASRLLQDMDRFAAFRASLPGQQGDEDNENGFLSTHPSTPERLSLAVAAARQIGGPDIANRENDSYVRALEGVLYGDDPNSGLVRGRRFLHPAFGFAFEAPSGFVLENSPRAVIGVSTDGRALRFDTIRVQPLTSLTESLQASATPELTIDNIERLTINGNEAATALGASPGWIFRFVLVRLGNDVYRFIFATRQMTPQIDAEFTASAASFRRLSPLEKSTIRPLRVRIVTVGPLDSVESLAERMVDSPKPVDQFLALNGLDRGQKLRLGMPVKIIAE